MDEKKVFLGERKQKMEILRKAEEPKKGKATKGSPVKKKWSSI